MSIRRGGKTVKRIARTGRRGANTIKVDVKSMPSGRYALTMTAKDRDANKATTRVSLRISR